jgi:6-phosphogluconolactonase
LSEPGAANVVIVADEATLAQTVAERFLAHAEAALRAHGCFYVALAGGSTPKAAYALLAAGYSEALDWDGVRFFFGDERCVAPDSDDSNYKMANTTLLGPLCIPSDHVFRMRGEDNPEQAARAYERLLLANLPLEGGVPVFDLVMLGMGPDGHTASLFPGSDPHAHEASLVRAPFVSNFGTYRITLTPRVLTAAHAIDVATAGPTKTAAFAAVVAGGADPVVYPIAVLAGAGARLTWLVDRVAAAGLRQT